MVHNVSYDLNGYYFLGLFIVLHSVYLPQCSIVEWFQKVDLDFWFEILMEGYSYFILYFLRYDF